MATTDFFDHVAALAFPLSTSPEGVDPPEAFADAQDQVAAATGAKRITPKANR